MHLFSTCAIAKMGHIYATVGSPLFWSQRIHQVKKKTKRIIFLDPFVSNTEEGFQKIMAINKMFHQCIAVIYVVLLFKSTRLR